MLQRASVGAENVLITGASGGVGAAAVQLARIRGATIWAMTQDTKSDAVTALGADHILARDADLPKHHFDVVVDLVGGPAWPALLDSLKRGGRYVTAGAIAGPIVDLDLRTLYLNDLTLLGSTYQEAKVFEDLISYVQTGKLRPAIADTYDLRDIHAAQEAFAAKTHVGKIVLRVPQ
jgi:NADPH:quinone reductase-like Zn-dependent oxidoreductase